MRRRSTSTHLHVTPLEDKLTPATLDVVGGVLAFLGDGGVDNVTQYVSGATLVINDSTQNISLLPDAIAAGWKGNGTKTVTGPRSSITEQHFNLGGGNDIFNLRACDVPVYIDGDGDTDTMNISSNAPSNTGNLASILAAVTVSDDGTGTLWVSDGLGAAGNAAVSIDPTGIYGFAGPTDNVAILTSGTFAAVRVTGSVVSAVSESFSISGSAGPLSLQTGNGNDSVYILGDTTLSSPLRLGGGDDFFYLAPGVTLNGDVYGDAGTDTFDIQGTLNGVWVG